MNEDVNANNWLCTHGLQDPVLDYSTSKAQIETLQNAGFHINFQSFNKDHSIDRDELTMISEWMKKQYPKN